MIDTKIIPDKIPTGEFNNTPFDAVCLDDNLLIMTNQGTIEDLFHSQKVIIIKSNKLAIDDVKKYFKFYDNRPKPEIYDNQFGYIVYNNNNKPIITRLVFNTDDVNNNGENINRAIEYVQGLSASYSSSDSNAYDDIDSCYDSSNPYVNVGESMRLYSAHTSNGPMGIVYDIDAQPKSSAGISQINTKVISCNSEAKILDYNPKQTASASASSIGVSFPDLKKSYKVSMGRATRITVLNGGLGEDYIVHDFNLPSAVSTGTVHAVTAPEFNSPADFESANGYATVYYYSSPFSLNHYSIPQYCHCSNAG